MRLEIIKKTIAILIFFISLYWGIIGVCWGRVVYGFIAVYFNSYYTKRLIGISLIQQLKDIIIPLLQAIGMGIAVGLTICYMQSVSLQIIFGIIEGIIIYIIIIFLTRKSYIAEIIKIGFDGIRRHNQ